MQPWMEVVTAIAMARLKVSEPRQQGYAHSAKIHKKTAKPTHHKKKPPPALGSDRASRARVATGTPAIKRRKPVELSPSSLAKIAMRYVALPKERKARKAPLAELCATYNLSPSYPPKVVSRLKADKKLP